MYFTVDAAVNAVRAGDVTSWAAASRRVGRNAIPELLLRLAGELRSWGELPPALAEAWTGPDSPEDALPREAWIAWLLECVAERKLEAQAG